jgi:alpha-ketoglutarate-dependent taurine dioxygenase
MVDLDTYRVSAGVLGSPVLLQEHLRQIGLALFSDVTEERFVEMFAGVGQPMQHRDGDADRITRVHVIESPEGSSPGYDGFTRQALPPHTDGSATSSPPALLAMLCLERAASGGLSLLADGRQVTAELIKHHPGAVRRLLLPRSVLFGAPPGFLGSILEFREDLLQVRYREDGLVDFSTEVLNATALWHQELERVTFEVDLNPGDGYLLDNRYWLHGRTAFAGNREMLRVLGQPVNDQRDSITSAA